MGGKIDYSVNNGKGPYGFRLHGQKMHLMGGLLPCPDERPRFSQLYIYDTDNEISNHLRSARPVRERAKSSNIDNLRLKLIKKYYFDSRVYNLPTASEVVALIVDMPDILTRVFKIKLYALYKDITKNGLFGKCRAGIYTIEFQKRGLLHAHILIWLNADEKFSTASQMDSVISAEIPNPDTDPQLTSFDEDGYAKYCHRDCSHKVVKNGIELDNRFVLPYNRHDKLTAALCNSNSSIGNHNNSNEIKMEPAVERLPFHLPNQQGVIFNDDDPIEEVVNETTVKETKFLAWFEPTIVIQNPGLLDDDKEYVEGIVEASNWSSGVYLHDILLKKRHHLHDPEIQLDDDRLKDIALVDIENMLRLNGRCLKDYSPMPLPNDAIMNNMDNVFDEQGIKL
ncbi:DeSI-like protein [Senna tora]|uniref:DeSI-like protein n=1 Tax=Senna tora TaxID=362788 RepID=A0A834T3G6_9FABA|nr:DeSI-like protein [Senna tora]